MRTLKTGEDIYLLKMEYILFLLLNGNVSAWFILSGLRRQSSQAAENRK